MIVMVTLMVTSGDVIFVDYHGDFFLVTLMVISMVISTDRC